MVGDACDNCPELSNPDQTDTDGNGIGDVCECRDIDGDGVCWVDDNCPNDYNQNQIDCDYDGVGDICDADTIDPDNDGVDVICDNCTAIANPGQEDNLPPGGNGIGDTCECEGDFDCDGDSDGTDASNFKINFGRNTYSNPCKSGDPCNGDFDCDGDADGTDAALFKSDFGRSQFQNACPSCVVADWCVYL